jgi:hypothetical protein
MPGRRRPRRVALAALAALGVVTPGAGAEDPPFEILEFPSPGRTVMAEFADVDGDGRTDLIQAVFAGLPPEEKRTLRVFRQGAQGEVPRAPTLEVELPAGSAAYDLADLLPWPGTELLLLREHGVEVLGLGGSEVHARQFPVDGGPTVAAAPDELGLDRLKLVWSEFGPEPWVLVPLAGATVVLDASGRTLARLDLGARANYLIPQRTGPVLFESEVQLFLDLPRLDAGDVDGDGRVDLLASSRYELLVILQREDGSLPARPDRRIALRLVDERDHIRSSGRVRLGASDLNGDRRVDLLISHSSGTFTDASARTTLHLNRGGGWDLEAPDRSFETPGAWASDQLVDLDGDGRDELVRTEIPVTVLEAVELLVQRSIDAHVTVYRQDGAAGFEKQPWLARKLAVPLDFGTSRPRGFIPNVDADLNGDGWRDLLSSGAGDALEVFLGGPRARYGERAARQELPTSGRVRYGKLAPKAGSDLLLYAPRTPDAPLRLAINRQRLPGTPPALVAGEPADQ